MKTSGNRVATFESGKQANGASGSSTQEDTMAKIGINHALAQELTRRLAQIYGGQFITDQGLFEPLIRFNPTKDREVGTVTDLKAQQLHSLSLELNEQAARLLRPRKPEHVREYELKVWCLMDQHRVVTQLFWNQVLATHTGEDLSGCTYEIRRGWKLVVPISSERLLISFGIREYENAESS